MADSMITAKEAAAILGVSTSTLAQWRYKRKKLPFYVNRLHSRTIMYKKSEVEALINEYECFDKIDPNEKEY